MFKRITVFATIFIAMLVISCQKEISFDLGSGGAGIGSGALKMKINGTQWVATKAISASIVAGFINIAGTSADNKSLSILLNDSLPGSYILDQSGFDGADLSDSSDLGGLSFTSGEGKDTTESGGVVIITSIDKVKKTISGSFHFKLFRSFDKKQKLITEGVFDKLPYSATLPPASLTDTFHVKIDNVDWTAKSITGLTSGTDLIINGSELDLTNLVALSIPSVTVPGTYNLDALAGIYIGLYSPNTTTILASFSGKVTIIEYNKATKRIRGSFDFKAIELGGIKTSQLSAGYFSLIYQ